MLPKMLYAPYIKSQDAVSSVAVERPIFQPATTACTQIEHSICHIIFLQLYLGFLNFLQVRFGYLISLEICWFVLLAFVYPEFYPETPCVHPRL